jgi:hypothetical protein
MAYFVNTDMLTWIFTGTTSLVIFLAVYIYGALALMGIAKKTKTRNAWLAWIPIANFYLLTQMAGKSGWWTLILLVSVIPFIGLIALGVMIWFFWIVVEKIKYPGWTSLLLLIPVVNLIMIGVWAWSKK